MFNRYHGIPRVYAGLGCLFLLAYFGLFNLLYNSISINHNLSHEKSMPAEAKVSSPVNATSEEWNATWPLPLETWLHDYGSLLVEPYPKENYNITVKRQRSLARLFRDFEALRESSVPDAEKPAQAHQRLIDKMRASVDGIYQFLYPWSQSSGYAELKDSFSGGGRGIVICIGQPYVKLAFSLIHQIRFLGCELPIEAFYAGAEDLSVVSREALSRLPNVTVRDLLPLFQREEEILDLSGYAIKPFAMLASSFQQVLLIDADAVFLDNPDRLFSYDGYVKTGTLFFKDRTMFNGEGPKLKQWIRNHLPTPIRPQILATRLFHDTTRYEQESGVVLIDKRRRLWGLLSTCKMNEKYEREQIMNEVMWGDKETFWLGFEFVQQPFYFSPHRVGIIGRPIKDRMDKVKICDSTILHLEVADGKRPLWWNGALVHDKKQLVMDGGLLNLTHFIMEEDNIQWIQDLPIFCLSVPKDSSKLNALQNQETDVIDTFQQRWLQLNLTETFF